MARPESTLPAIELPAPDEVDVWHLDLGPDARIHHAWLSAAEQRRITRLRQTRRQLQLAAGRTAMRGILGAYLGRDPATLELQLGPHGKPCLAPPEPLHFNLSHSRDRGLLAVARHPVGVDIEAAKPGRRFADLARRFFARQEAARVLALDPSAQALAFYQLWAFKEAYLKAYGTGLSFASNRFCLRPTAGGWAEVEASEMPAADICQLKQLHSTFGFAAGLCLLGPRFWIRHQERSALR